MVTANENSGTPMFSIAHTDVLRIQVYLPQDDYFGMKDGDEAKVTVPELPGRVFHGRLARNASALQPDTRTVLARAPVSLGATLILSPRGVERTGNRPA